MQAHTYHLWNKKCFQKACVKGLLFLPLCTRQISLMNYIKKFRPSRSQNEQYNSTLLILFVTLLTIIYLLLLSHFSRVQLCVTPQTAAHQAPPSLGFSGQKCWSGLPFPSPVHACMLSRFSRVQLCATLWTAAHQAPLSMGFSRQEYWRGLPFPSPHLFTTLLYQNKLSEIFLLKLKKDY